MFLSFGVEPFEGSGLIPETPRCFCNPRAGGSPAPAGIDLAWNRGMENSLHYRIGIFWIVIFLIFATLRSAHAATPPPEPGFRVEFMGKSYEIWKEPSLNVIKVTTDRINGPIRDELILKIKREHLPPRHIHVRLSGTTPESMIYTGILPSRVLWQGNLSIEIGTPAIRR